MLQSYFRIRPFHHTPVFAELRKIGWWSKIKNNVDGGIDAAHNPTAGNGGAAIDSSNNGGLWKGKYVSGEIGGFFMIGIPIIGDAPTSRRNGGKYIIGGNSAVIIFIAGNSNT